MININEIKDKVLKGYKITKEEALELYKAQDIEILKAAANEIREKLCGKSVDLCSIVNGKSGKCSENCKYCAQSIHFKTGVQEYPLMSYEEVEKIARENEEEGVNRFSIVTSGKGLYGKDFDRVVDYYDRLNKNCGISLCASHGIVDKESLDKLKKVGVKRYHHNLETSARYYEEICTTHTYQERIDTIKYAKELGLEVCSGGIIGMGESVEDRVELALTLRDLEIKSIPVNALMAIPGTPLEKQENLSEGEILRSIAMFRFVNPTANIRLAAGRNLLTGFGESAFKAGANATITGNLLTTCGNKIKDDKEMIKNIGLKVGKQNG
ncbi:MAG: biotin synthase BioB [Sarcina sp.]